MTSYPHSHVQYVSVDGATLAYRRFGRRSGTPLVMLMHFRGNMSFWDPALLAPLSASRQVLLLDNAGIGRSSGTVPTTIAGWASYVVALLRALQIVEIDLLGFSMGGAAAQMVALNAPGLVRKLILAGTRPSMGPKTVNNPDRTPLRTLAHAMTDDEVERAFAETFFCATAEGRAAAKASWRRISDSEFYAKEDRVGILDQTSTKRQLEAINEWATPNPENSYDRLGDLEMPVFVANGDNDVLIPSVNSWVLMERIGFAHLHIYPRAGHGFLFQYAELFAKHVDMFLDGAGVESGHTLSML